MWALSSYSFHYLLMVFKQPLVSNLRPHCFHLDSSLKCSSNIPNWLSRIPTQYSLVNSELLFFITIQYTIINSGVKSNRMMGMLASASMETDGNIKIGMSVKCHIIFFYQSREGKDKDTVDANMHSSYLVCSVFWCI